MPRIIQNKTLPKNWLDQIEKFDIKSSTLSTNNQLIANFLIPYIQSEKEKSFSNGLIELFVKFIIFKTSDFLYSYDNVPYALLSNALTELKGEKGFNFSRKLHSLFVEFQIYLFFINNGYSIENTERTNGNCDLVMSRDNKIYNFEIKFKENDNIHISRLFDYIEGFSLLQKNKFLRGKCFEINLKVDNITYENLQCILCDINQFVINKKESYDGNFIQIFPCGKIHLLSEDIQERTKYTKKNEFTKELTDIRFIENLIQTLFIEKNGHISKLIKKSKKFKADDNFNGCLVWSVPFHNQIDKENIEEAFNNILKLNFDLHVFISGVMKEEIYFVVKKVLSNE